MDMNILTGLEALHRFTACGVQGLYISQEKPHVDDSVFDKGIAERCGERQDSDTAADEVLGDRGGSSLFNATRRL